MNYLSLFTGAGGGDLACQHLLGWTCLGYVEIDHYCQEVIKARIADGYLDAAPIFGDIREFIGEGYAEAYQGVDCLAAGFSCQPFSMAGPKTEGGHEQNTWPETAECLRIIRPGYAYLENVPRLLRCVYYETICGDLAEGGYDAEWDGFPASACHAHFRGDRLFIAARRTASRGRRWEGCGAFEVGAHPWGRDEFQRLVRLEVEHGVPAGSLGRISDGCPSRMDRLRALGNMQVPLVAATAWRLLTGG